MSTTDWMFLVFFLLALFAVIGIAEVIRRIMNWSSGATRKLVHILVGVLVATTPFVLESMWPMIILGIAFTFIDYFAIRKNLLKVMHGSKRRSYGTVFYPISFIILTATLWENQKFILIVSMLIMALADATAAIVGEHAKKPKILKLDLEQKSLQGSIAMFLTTFFILLLSFLAANQLEFFDFSIASILFISSIVGVVATCAEVLSFNGSDNLSVPLASAFTLYYLLNESTQRGCTFTLGLGIALAIAIVSYRLRFLSGSGSVALVLLGTLVFGVGGWMFSGPILIFFILSSILSKVGKKRKTKLLTVFEKSGTRDAAQVLANGGVAGLMLVFWYFGKNDMFYVAYIAALAAVTADTWATEVGVLAKGNPRSILTFKRVPMGTSGGISLIGTIGALLGSLVLTASGVLFSLNSSPYFFTWPLVVLVLASGLMASMVDSMLGATVQAQFRCPACNKVTEKHIHCDNTVTKFHSGFRWINNDVVNGLCAVSGVLFVWGYWLIFGR